MVSTEAFLVERVLTRWMDSWPEETVVPFFLQYFGEEQADLV